MSRSSSSSCSRACRRSARSTRATSRSSSRSSSRPTSRSRTPTVIAPAEPPARASFPPSRMIVAGALVLALIAGIGLAFIREHFVGGITNVEQLEGLSGVPVVAAVPQLQRVRGAQPGPRDRDAAVFRLRRIGAAHSARHAALPQQEPEVRLRNLGGAGRRKDHDRPQPRAPVRDHRGVDRSSSTRIFGGPACGPISAIRRSIAG